MCLGMASCPRGVGEMMLDYLQKILSGEPINYGVFLKMLPERFRSRHGEIFSTDKVGASRWVVSIRDESAFAELLYLAQAPVDRVDAAKRGDSHRHGTAVSFLPVYHHGLNSTRPDLVVIAGDSVDMGFQIAPQVLVVENEYNFYKYQQTLAYAGQMTETPLSMSSCDVVFGAGNRVTNESVTAWLSEYNRVFCAFDYDAGGLHMFNTISSRLGDTAVFVQPDDWQPWLECFVKTPESTERYTSALRLAENLGFRGLAEAFRRTGKFMEQEALLDE